MSPSHLSCGFLSCGFLPCRMDWFVSLPAWFPWVPISQVTLGDGSKVTGAWGQGIYPRKTLALINPLDPSLGLNFPSVQGHLGLRHPRQLCWQCLPCSNSIECCEGSEILSWFTLKMVCAVGVLFVFFFNGFQTKKHLPSLSPSPESLQWMVRQTSSMWRLNV